MEDTLESLGVSTITISKIHGVWHLRAFWDGTWKREDGSSLKEVFQKLRCRLEQVC